MGTDRINSAYSRCGSKGRCSTVEKLTDLPVNYLITVNFHGFKEVVDKLGGVWMDVDRRYYNRNTGSAADNFANINLQPGYQRLDGQNALDFVRYRHTDSDLYRVARQQEFVRAFREQVGANFSPFSVPTLVNAITRNIEVAEGGRKLQGKQVLQLRALRLRPVRAAISSRTGSTTSSAASAVRRRATTSRRQCNRSPTRMSNRRRPRTRPLSAGRSRRRRRRLRR